MTDRKPTLIIAASVILGCAIIGFNFKKLNSNPGAENSITVQGEGKSMIIPNIYTFSVIANETGSTTKEVSTTIAKKLDQAQQILKDNKIDAKDIQSSNISTNENREYDGTTSAIKWYRGTHTLTIKVRTIDNAGKIMDQLSAINGLLIQGGSYDNDSEDATLADARAKAFANAKTKAEALAKLAGVKLGKPLSINESVINNGYYQPMYKAMDSVAESAPSTTISAGEKELQVQLNIVFETN